MATAATKFGVLHATNGDNIPETVLIRHLYWDGATGATDDLIIKDGTGATVLALKAGTNLARDIEWPFGNRWLIGLESDTIDNGQVYYMFE